MTSFHSNVFLVDLSKAAPPITIITDASWCPKTKIAGWAAWCVCDAQRLKVSGAIRRQMDSSNHAELSAILNGLHSAVQYYNPTPYTRILIQSDSLFALHKLGERNSEDPFVREAAQKYREILEGRSLHINIRHVKGHRANAAGKRFYVNNWADNEARSQMRTARAKCSGK